MAHTQFSTSEPFWTATFSDPIATFTFFLVVATIVLGAATILLWLTTKRIAIDTKEAGNTQAEKMERSIEEAAKSADAMKGVAASMAINAAQIVQSVAFQRQYGQMQLRPYLSILIGEGLYQDDSHIFEIRPKILNTGHTPARDVRWRIALDILPVNLPADFRFKLPKEVFGGNMISPHQDYQLSACLPYRVPEEEVVAIRDRTSDRTLLLWGCVSYRDALKRRYMCTFAQRVWWERFADGTIPPRLRGLYLMEHNRAN